MKTDTEKFTNVKVSTATHRYNTPPSQNLCVSVIDTITVYKLCLPNDDKNKAGPVCVCVKCVVTKESQHTSSPVIVLLLPFNLSTEKNKVKEIPIYMQVTQFTGEIVKVKQ